MTQAAPFTSAFWHVTNSATSEDCFSSAKFSLHIHAIGSLVRAYAGMR